MTFNVWVSMSGEYQSELKEYVKFETPAVVFPSINDISTPTVDLFVHALSRFSDGRYFKRWEAAGREYRLWSFYADKPASGTQQIKADLDMLIAAAPQDFSVIGAWSYDTGLEVGQEDPWYPIPHQTINFMPDVQVPGSDPPVYEPATELADVVKLAGQAPRSFASYVPN